MKDYEYIIALEITPKDPDTALEYDYVSEQLGIRPTGITRKGQKMRGGLGRIGRRYDRWWWRLATRPRSYATGRFSAHLTSFLRRLPHSKKVWARVSEHCDCQIYLPVERDYFLIEFDLEPSASYELALRNLTMRVSTLSRYKEEPNQTLETNRR